MDDIYIYYAELPNGFYEAVMPCQTGYTVYIDPRQSEDGIRRSYDHALYHIQNHDFEKTDVQSIELEAHKYMKGEKNVGTGT